VVSIFPVVGHASIANDKPDELWEARLGTNIVQEDDNATLSGLDANYAARGLAVMPTLEKAVTLRSVENHNAQTWVKILALPGHKLVRLEKRELISGRDAQLRLCDLGARGHTQAFASNQRSCELRKGRDRCIH
jgi:hypothetical protein